MPRSFGHIRAFLPPAAVLVCVVALVGCGGNGAGANSTATGPSGPGKAQARIRHNWSQFFSGSSSVSQRVALLQHGQQFKQALVRRQKSPLAKQASATVSKVKLTGPSKAKVRYTILVAGKPALKNRPGTAVLAKGVWKVSDKSFCRLLALQGGPPPACQQG